MDVISMAVAKTKTIDISEYSELNTAINTALGSGGASMVLVNADLEGFWAEFDTVKGVNMMFKLANDDTGLNVLCTSVTTAHMPFEGRDQIMLVSFSGVVYMSSMVRVDVLLTPQSFNDRLCANLTLKISAI